MDSHIQKLKASLNIKFQPLHRQVRKKPEQDQTKPVDLPKINKNRSISHVRLPSLNKSKVGRLGTVEDSRAFVNVVELKQRSKSFKQIPKVKVQSREPIGSTLTYLLKNQVLNIPRIVSLLQKTNSQQFIYLRKIGIYKYEATNQRVKGYTYVTVSKNGMVENGELIPLDTLVREFQIYRKLKQIMFFKYYHKVKYLDRWRQGLHRARFADSKRVLAKELSLNDRKLLEWRIEIFGMFRIEKQGGSMQSYWIMNTISMIKQMKQQARNRLVEICFKMLEKFDLPISESTDLMNRVLSNLSALSISFEKKLRVEKQVEKFYKLGRQLQLVAMEKTGQFIIKHMQALIQKVRYSSQNYKTNILQFLQKLDIRNQNYSSKKQTILLDSSGEFEIDYCLQFDQNKRILQIKPNAKDVYDLCLSHIKNFLKQVDQIGFRIIRVQQFSFIYKNVFKTEKEDSEDEEESKNIFKRFVFGMAQYEQLQRQLESTFVKCVEIFNRKIQTLMPFLELYLSYLNKEAEQGDFTFIDLINERQKMDEDLKMVEKIGEGQPFIFGFLKTNNLRIAILNEIQKYEQNFFRNIPIQLNLKKQRLEQILKKHQQVFNLEIDTASSFIKISEEAEKIQDSFLEYSATIDEIEKIQDFYEKSVKRKLMPNEALKKMLSEIRIKMRSFSQSRESSFAKYRKSIQQQKQKLVEKIGSLALVPQDLYNPESDPEQMLERSSSMVSTLKQIQKQVKQLNHLQIYYGFKVSIFGGNEIPIKQYKVIEQIWQYWNKVDNDTYKLSGKPLKQIDISTYIRSYEQFIKVAQRYLKDPNLSQIASSCLKKVNTFFTSMEIISLMKQQHLRNKDLVQINLHLQKALKEEENDSIKCLQITYETLTKVNLPEMKNFVSEVVFKSKKQMEIIKNLEQFNDWWKNVKLEYEVLEGYPLIYIYSENLQVRDQIDEKMTMLLNILNNKYGTFVRGECHQLLKRLNSLADMLELAEAHQQKFLHLFPILTSKYAQSQLASECARFETILIKNMKNVRGLAKPTEHLNETMKNLFKNNIKQFDSINKHLTRFLQKKRLKFQRFYFLQDYELLEVLVGIADHKNVFRMFDGVKGWLFSPQGIRIGVTGIGNQHLVLKGWNYKSSDTELIFKTLQESIKTNLNSIVRNTLYQYEIQMKQLNELYVDIPWMCIYAVELILFTKQVQLNCFYNGISMQAQKSLIKQAISNAKELDPKIFSNYITLKIQLLHFVSQLQHSNCNSVLDFEWHSFLRFYYEQQGVNMRALSTQLKWGGEYQGLWTLMVTTADIRRAHICVLNSIHYASGVLLQGPSGTGKTQTLKQLARCTAKYCVVFNCSQNVNLNTMGKLLSALCYTASWLCLDQINRLTLESMSVIAKQIQNIKIGIVSHRESVTLLGKEIKLKPGVAIFATMNPIYLRRVELTQNIKECFRTVTVAMPQYSTILEVLLHGMKMSNSNELVQKIGSTFATLSIQLGSDSKFDFGLRAMKFLISRIGQRKTKENDDETIVGQSFYDVFLNRLNDKDKPVFEKTIFDNFKYKPSTVLNNRSRVSEMRETKQTGIIVFGPVSIKSTLIKEFCKSYENSYIKLFNPISTDLKYFLGQFVHGKWEQGIVERICRESLNNPQKMHILVLDSVLKSQIIQNFNTLLDESKLLTLSNGTRLKILDNLKIVMQTPNLTEISPSTITRCNIFYVEDRDVETDNLIKSQIPKVPHHLFKYVAKIIQIYKCFKNSEIRSIAQIAKIILADKFASKKQEWKDGDLMGLEKAVLFACRLLGFDEQVQPFLHKDNSISIKKNPYNFILNFERYSEGEFIDISRTYDPLYIDESTILLKTAQVSFCEWITKKSILLPRQPIIWSGKACSGKTKSLIWSLKDQRFLKIALNYSFNTDKIVKILLPQMLDKKVQEIKAKPELVIYLQNLHMSNEQVCEQFRFMMQHNMIFSTQTRDIVPILAMAFISESRILQNSEFQRLRRHFSEFTYPQADQIQIRNIYNALASNEIQKLDIENSFRNILMIESDKFCTFLTTFYQKQLQDLPDSRGFFHLSKILHEIKNIGNETQQVSSFISMMLSSLLAEIYFTNKQKVPSLQNLILQTYKKVPKQTLKLSPLDQQIQLDNVGVMGIVGRVCRGRGGRGYVDQRVRVQAGVLVGAVAGAGVVLLVGEVGAGRRTLLKIGCQILGLNYVEFTNDITEKDIRSFYFQKMKRGFQTNKKQVVILNLDDPHHRLFVEFVERIKIGDPVTSIFEIDETDYMYARNLDYEKQKYDKNFKSYEQVCQNFVQFSEKYVTLLMVSSSKDESVSYLKSHCPSVQKETYLNILPDYPLQSIVQCMQQIIEQNFSKEQQNWNDSDLIKTLPRLLMKIYKALRDLGNGGQWDYITFNHFHAFKFAQLLCQNYTKIAQQTCENQQKLKQSVIKVVETSRHLQKLQQEITRLQPDISAKKNRVLQVVPILQVRKRKAQDIKFLVQSERREIQVKKEEIQGIMKEVQNQIMISTPILNEAMQSIQTIKRTDLSEIKNNLNPHPLIKFTMQNIVILLGESDSWQNIKRILSDINLISRIKNCQPTKQAYLRVKKRVQENEDWNYDSVSKTAYGTRFFYKWVMNILKHKALSIQIQDQKNYIQKLRVSLIASQIEAKQKIQELDKNEKQLAQIIQEYSSIKKQLNDLEELIFENKKKLNNAEIIKNNLQENVKKWQYKLEQIQQRKGYLLSYSIFMCLQISIYPSLSSEQQSKLKKQISKVFVQQRFPLPRQTNIFQDVITSQNWDLFKRLSHQDLKDPKKVMLAYHFHERPLIIDPDNQAENWLLKIFSDRKVTFTKKHFAGSLKIAEQAMRNGQILALLVDDQIDALGYEIIRTVESSNRSSQNLIEFNNSTFEVHKDFTLLFFCKLNNPKISVETSLSFQVINFQITKESLKQSLLEYGLKTEKPQLAEIKFKIEEDLDKTSKLLDEMQKEIIRSLLNNKKQLMDDDSFVQLLEANRKKAEFYEQKKKYQEQSIEAAAHFRSQFSQICGKIADIFVCLKPIRKVNANLVWNVQILIHYFQQSCKKSAALLNIDNSDDEEEDKNHLDLKNNLNKGFEFEQIKISKTLRPASSLSSVSLGLSMGSSEQNHENQDILSSAQSPKPDTKQFQSVEGGVNINISTSINPNVNVKESQNIQAHPIFGSQNYIVNQEEVGTVSKQRYFKIINFVLNRLKKCFSFRQRLNWALLLILKDEKQEDINCLMSLISFGQKKNIQLLADQSMLTPGIKRFLARFQFEKFEQQATKVLNLAQDQKYWKQGNQFNKTEILILAHLFSYQDFIGLVKNLLSQMDLSQILEYEQADSSEWISKNDHIHPTLLFMGEDPIQALSEYFQKKRFKNATLVAMGQEQGKDLDYIIERESRKEGILIIHNIHINVAFLPLLGRIVQQFNYKPPNKNFRLVLIGNSKALYPDQLVSMCHKFLIEEPPGLKNKILNLLVKSQSIINHKSITEHRLCFSLCLLHSLINQMQRYGHLCWNFPQSFTTNDFFSALLCLKKCCNAKQISQYICNIEQQQIQKQLPQKQIDFNSLVYLVGEISYVAKMTDKIDRQKMRLILRNHFNSNVAKSGYVFWQGTKGSEGFETVGKTVQKIQENNARTFGIDQKSMVFVEMSHKVMTDITKVLGQGKGLKPSQFSPKFEKVPEINHKLSFINDEIVKYNSRKVYDSQSIALKQLTPNSLIFDLKAFTDPRQLFVSVKIEAALKNNVPYDSISLQWMLVPKDNMYGVFELILEGGQIKNGYLIPGHLHKNVTVYFSAVVTDKHKEKESNKNKVKIPLYFNKQRGEFIGTFGENTNLLAEIVLDSKENQEFWILRSTAFIVK